MKQLFTPYILVLFLLLSFQKIISQEYSVKFSFKNKKENTTKIYKIKTTDSIKTTHRIDSLKRNLEKEGYFNIERDSIIRKEKTITYYFSSPKKIAFTFIYHNEGFIERKLLLKHSKKATDSTFLIKTEKLNQTFNDIIAEYDRKGFSFTKLKLSNITIKNDTAFAELKIKTSSIRKIDKIVINGYKKFPKSYLKNYLDLKKGELFSNEKLKELSKRIQNLRFVEQTKSPQVLFTNDSTFLYLNLKKRKSNRFDGLVGFTTNPNTEKLQFNGYLDLELNNVLNSGEKFNINWNNNGNEVQTFKLGIKTPFIFNSRFTPQLIIDIFRQDSSFVNSSLKLQTDFFINTQNTIGLFLENQSSNRIKNLEREIINYNSSFYGISYNFNQPHDNNLFFDKLNLKTSLALGRRNSKISNDNQFKLYNEISYLLSLDYRNHIYTKNTTSFLSSKNYLENELFRIGGQNNIRGTIENSIFSSFYNISNLEYRYLTNTKSYLYTITDFSYVKNSTLKTTQKIYSLGLGYAFTTKVGMLNLSYGISKSHDGNFDLRKSIIMINFLNYF